MPPLTLSVVIPTYNRGRYLPDAVDSALGQVGVKVDVIVVDDESTDETRAVVRRHAPLWGSRVRYLWQEHAERSAARNAGLRHATSEFVAFMDSDDIWRPNHAQTCVKALAAHPEVVVAYGEYGLIAPDGKIISNHVRRRASQDEQFRRDLCLKRLIIPPTGAVIRRSALGTGDAFDSACVVGEDWLLWVTLAARAPFHGVGEPTVWMRLHPHESVGDPRELTRSLMRATEKVIDTGLPRQLGIAGARIRAVNLTHAAYAYFVLGRGREAAGLLLAALREWPRVSLEPDFWRLCGRLCVGKRLSRRIRAARQRGRGPVVEVIGPRPL